MRKLSISLIITVALTIFSFSGPVSAQTVITLQEAKLMAREQGRELKLLDLSISQADLGLAIAKSGTGIGSYYDSKAMKRDLDDLESIIDERVKAVTMLEKNIEQWEKEKGDSGSDIATLDEQIEKAYQEKNQYQGEIDDLRRAHVNMVPAYHAKKSYEDMVKPQFKPYEDALNQLTDAQAVQPRLMDYNIEKLYLSLLTLLGQEEMLEKSLQIAVYGLQAEELKHDLGLSTGMQVAAAEEKVLQCRETLQGLKAENNGLSRTFLCLIGLPLDLDYTLLDVNLVRVYPLPEDENLPDFTGSVAYQSACRNFQDAKEDLEDAPKSDYKKFRLAEVNLEEAELQLQKQFEELEKNFLSKKECFHVACSAVIKAELSLEKAKKILKTAEASGILGMLSPLELDGARLAYLQTELDYQTTLVQRQLAYQVYQLAIEGIIVQDFST